MNVSAMTPPFFTVLLSRYAVCTVGHLPKIRLVIAVRDTDAVALGRRRFENSTILLDTLTAIKSTRRATN